MVYRSQHDPGARRPVARRSPPPKASPARRPHPFRRRRPPLPRLGARLPEATAPAQQAASPPRLANSSGILPQDSRMEAYQQFRSLYELARFDEALPYAKRVVELSEADAERDHELPIAYNNLGATQYQLGDYAAAEDSYTQVARAARKRPRAFRRGGSWCRSPGSARCTRRRTSTRSRRSSSTARSR